MNLARDVKGSKRDFYKDVNKGNTRESVGLLLNPHSGALVTQDMEKAEVINEFFTSIFTGKTSLQESQPQKIRGKVRSK